MMNMSHFTRQPSIETVTTPPSKNVVLPPHTLDCDVSIQCCVVRFPLSFYECDCVLVDALARLTDQLKN